MKRIALLLLTVSLMAVGTALADPIALNLTPLAGVDITSTPGNPTVAMLDAGSGLNVNIWYEPQTIEDDPAILAAIFGDSILGGLNGSIFGSTLGALFFQFSQPVLGLNVDFVLLGVVPPAPDPLQGALLGFFGDTGFAAADAFADANDPSMYMGQLSYMGGSFTQATLFFAPDAAFFSAENITYQPVPEPVSLLLVGSGLAGFCGRRMLRRKA